MSQAKVERYKQKKANRKQQMAKERFKKMIARGVALVISVLAIAAAGAGGYRLYDANRPAKTYYCDTSALEQFMSEMSY